MAFYNCRLVRREGETLPESITIKIPALNGNMTDRLANNSEGGFNEEITVDTGVDLGDYDVSGGTVSGTKIIVNRRVTVKNNPSNVYIMFIAPQVTVTATRKK